MEAIKDLILSRKILLAALISIVLFYVVGLFGWIFSPYDYRVQDFSAIRQGPSMAHWFGTDLLGRDIFSRILFAARTSVFLSLMVVFTGGLPFAVAVGILSGYLGRGVDFLIMRVGELLQSIPALFLILFLTATVRPRYDNFIFSLGSFGREIARQGWADLFLIFIITSLIYWVGPARLYRSQILVLRESLFVDSAKVLGASAKRIIGRHLLPHIYPLIVYSGFSMLASVIFTEIALSFFGIGIRPPTPSFGAMIREASNIQLLDTSAHLLLFPALVAIFYIFSLLFSEMNINQILSSVYERRR
jgi:ABC-type dipeptide/oligopeptide/nickel transport system permease subunit